MAKRSPERAIPVIKRFAASKSEVEQQAAFQAMGQLPGPQSAPLLVGSIDQFAAGKVAPAAQVELFDTVEKSTAPTVKARWEKQQAVWAGSNDRIGTVSICARGRQWLARV